MTMTQKAKLSNVSVRNKLALGVDTHKHTRLILASILQAGIVFILLAWIKVL